MRPRAGGESLEANRCIDPRVGVKVLSYDLLHGEERVEVDQHLEQCVACRDLFQQTFGDEGALQDLEWRAYQLSRRQPVAPHQWLGRRLADLWLPILLVVLGVASLILYLTQRHAEAERVGVVRLATLRDGQLDSVAAAPLLHMSPQPSSVILCTDRDAIALVYETGAGALRRLVPGDGAPVPELRAGSTQELSLPEVANAGSRILLLLAPRSAPRGLEDWDRAVMERLGAKTDAPAPHGWPAGTEPTLRWLR